MIPEKEREALMRLTMCARNECVMCKYKDSCDSDVRFEFATKHMNILADALRKTEPNSSEKPNNCEWSVEYAKEMLDTMPCEECGHWEHGAGDHYYCALLEMRQECCFESKDESTLMFANIPQTERSNDGN